MTYSYTSSGLRRLRRAGGRIIGRRGSVSQERLERYSPFGEDPEAAFSRWCAEQVQVIDKERTPPVHVPLELWPGQRAIAGMLVHGTWLLILKGRQIGMTTYMAGYVLWRMLFHGTFLAGVVFQEALYAQEFKVRVLDVLEHIDEDLRGTVRRERDNVRHLVLRRLDGQKSELFCFVGGTAAARSFTGDLYVVDEAAYVEALGPTLAAVQPSLAGSERRTRPGQCIALSTAPPAPAGDYFDLWQATYGGHGELLDPETRIGPTGFRPVFMHWSGRPGRSAAWHARECEKVCRATGNPVAGKREYPETPEEAFEHAAGRVYPMFTRDRCVGRLDPIPRSAVRYRAVDWGETRSAYVVLWIAHIPGPAGFLVSPDCPNTIREFLAYRLDEDPPYDPLDEDDHCPDAVRYAVVTFRLRGLVYVYREVYRTELIQRGWSLAKMAQEVHELSGWEEAPPDVPGYFQPTRFGEEIRSTVADSAQLLAIAEFNKYGIPTVPSKKAGLRRKPRKGEARQDKPRTDRLEGIRRVSELILGTEGLEKFAAVTREQESIDALLRDQAEQRRVPHSVDLKTAQRQEMARTLLKRQRERR